MLEPSPHLAPEPRIDADALLLPFRTAEKPLGTAQLGVELEKFGVADASGRPLGYGGPDGVERIFEGLSTLGYTPEREAVDGPVIALRGQLGGITLEPGAQLELSAAPVDDVHAVRAQLQQHMQELEVACAGLPVRWLATGFHPLASQSELPWVPKQRYAIMKNYLPGRGAGALDMMRRTATVQVNFDYTGERDALDKLSVLLKLSPLLHAMTANAPFKERRYTGCASLRGDVWLNMDPHRSGLISQFWALEEPRYQDYVNWALEAGMFLIKRHGRVVANTGQTFRNFMQEGFQGQQATLTDWKLHLNTLFPEVRLKNTLEVRMCDALPLELSCAAVALMTGLVYDEHALVKAREWLADYSFEQAERERPDLVRRALRATYAGQPAREQAERLLELAKNGLERRARTCGGSSERDQLVPLEELTRRGQCPADRAAEGLSVGQELSVEDLIARTQVSS